MLSIWRWACGARRAVPNSASASITIAHAGGRRQRDDRVDVVYVKPGGAPFHRVLKIRADNFVTGPTGISFSGNETPISVAFNFNATPMLVASGYRQLDLIGRVFGNHLRHSLMSTRALRFKLTDVQSPRLAKSMNMNANLSAAGRMTSEQVIEFAAAATPTGRVEVAARAWISDRDARTLSQQLRGQPLWDSGLENGPLAR